MVLNLTEIIAVSQNFCSRNNFETFADGVTKDYDNYRFGIKWLRMAAQKHPTLVKNVDKYLNRKRPKEDTE